MYGWGCEGGRGGDNEGWRVEVEVGMDGGLEGKVREEDVEEGEEVGDWGGVG